jgi:hypothetical protein
MIKSKADLKAKFKTNCVPTETDFADLIDSGINQLDDGVKKNPGDPLIIIAPLTIVAAGETLELLSLSKSNDTKQPAVWKVNLNPGATTTGAKPGFNISSEKGESRFFIDEETGNAGVGNITPKAKLDVMGDISARRGITVTDGITMLNSGVINFTGVDGKGVADLCLFSRVEERWIRIAANKAPIVFSNDINADNKQSFVIEATGNIYTTGDLLIGAREKREKAPVKLDVAGAIHFDGDGDKSFYTKPGGYLGWDGNKLGETNFINHKGRGPGGFNFQNSDGTTLTPLVNIKGSGNLQIEKGNLQIGIRPEDQLPPVKLSVEGSIFIAGEPVGKIAFFSKQGTYITWNWNGEHGYTSFINHMGTGNGGFRFYDTVDGKNLNYLGGYGPRGNFGIGAEDPEAKLHIKGSGQDAYLKITKDNGITICELNKEGQLRVEGKLVAGSDIRIKKDMEDSNTLKDLDTLSKLKVIDYRRIDPAIFGGQRVKGLLAQQVEQVFPEAVVIGKEFIPDIYDNAESVTAEKGIVIFTMRKPHALKNSDVVKLITKAGSKDKPVTIVNENAFSVDGSANEYEDTLVYGKQVDDFRMIEHNRLFILNISATQQLIIENEKLKDKNEALEARLAGFEERLNAIERVYN